MGAGGGRIVLTILAWVVVPPIAVSIALAGWVLAASTDPADEEQGGCAW